MLASGYQVLQTIAPRIRTPENSHDSWMSGYMGSRGIEMAIVIDDGDDSSEHALTRASTTYAQLKAPRL